MKDENEPYTNFYNCKMMVHDIWIFIEKTCKEEEKIGKLKISDSSINAIQKNRKLNEAICSKELDNVEDIFYQTLQKLKPIFIRLKKNYKSNQELYKKMVDEQYKIAEEKKTSKSIKKR